MNSFFMIIRKAGSKALFILSLMLLSFSTNAFKLGSHVWIGQQIINDLEDDGKLTFIIGDKTIKVAVSEELKNEILNNKSDFLAGNIGPDAFPDVVVGQTTVHPGVDGGWQTNDWMEYLLDASEQNQSLKAFSYGYIGHAAADVMAHTYVNQYAGDVYNFQDEILVEKRHTILEAYIDKLLPPLVDHLGNSLGGAHEQIVLDDSFGNLVRDNLVYNDEVRDAYLDSGFGLHLAAYYALRQSVDTLAEDGIWHDMDIVIIQFIAEYYDIELSAEEASLIADLANEVVDAVNEDVVDNIQLAANELYELAAKYEQMGYQTVIDGVNTVSSIEQELITHRHQVEDDVVSLSSELNASACNLLGEFVDDPLGLLDPLGIIDPAGVAEHILAHSPGHALLSGILDSFLGSDSSPPPPPKVIWSITGDKAYLLSTAARYEDYYIDYIDHREPGGCGMHGCAQNAAMGDEIAELLTNGAEGLDDGEIVTLELWSNDNSTIEYPDGSGFLCNNIANLSGNIKRDLLNSIQSLELEIIAERDEIVDEVGNLRDEMLTALTSIRNAENAIIDLTQQIGQDINPIQGVLKGWRGDLDIAMREYVKASGQMMINTIDTDVSVETLEPLEVWLECYHGAIIGLPLPLTGCDGVVSSFSDLKNSLTNIVDIVNNMHLPPGLDSAHNELKSLKDDIADQLIDELKEVLIDEIKDLVPENVQELIEVANVEVTDEVLNQYFSQLETTSTPKNLIYISDMADRVREEMKITNGQLDPYLYPVVYNAIVLVKLAMLDATGLQDFENQSGLNLLNSSLLAGYDNLVATAFEDIDGNHQWMPTSPPLPNALGEPYLPIDASYDTPKGFLLWDESVRDEIFDKLFIGPISPGIDAPSSIGKSNIVPNSYRYNPCSVNPFPSEYDDQTCIAVWLIPILSTLQ